MNDTAAVPHLPEDPSAAAAAAGRNNLLLEKDNLVNNPASTGALSLVCRRIGTGECLELRVSPHESVADVRARLAIAQAGAAALTTSTHSPTAPSIKTSDVYMVYCGRCLRDSDRVVDVVGQKANSSNVLPIYYSISARSQALSPENTHSPHTPMKAALLGSPFTSPSSSSGSRGVMMSPRSVAAALQWLEMCDPRVHSEQARRVRDVLAACGIDAPPTWVPSIETCYAYRLEDLDDFDDLNSLDGDGDAGAAADSVTPGAAAAGAAEAAPEAPEPPIPRPNWIDLYIIPNIVVGLYLFGEKLSLPAQVAVGVAYYLFHTGVLHFLVIYAFRRFIKRSARFHRLASFIESGAGVASGGLHAVTSTPRSPGIVYDVIAFFGAFICCLLPSYYPHASAAEPVVVPPEATHPPAGDAQGTHQPNVPEEGADASVSTGGASISNEEDMGDDINREDEDEN